jgi:branched-chain amino acid aminotransferase
VRAYNTDNGPAIFRVKEHTERLFEAAKIVNIDIPYSTEEIIEAQKTVLIKNNFDEAYIRPIIYLGNESLGLRAEDLSVNVIIAAWEWPSYMDPESKQKGISVVKSPYKQYKNPNWSNYKITGTYVNSIVALQDAVAKGADEALILDNDGYISEGSGENIFFLKDGLIMTPTTKNCLNGITRQSVIEIAKGLGHKVEEGDWSYEHIIECDEAFFTGTAVEVTPITKIDGKIISNGTVGSITKEIQTNYENAVLGTDDNSRNWLTYIE